MPREKKRSSAKSRKQQPASPKSAVRTSPAASARPVSAVTKKSKRKQHSPAGEVPADSFAYGTRTISRTSAQGLSITVQIPPLRRPKANRDATNAPRKRRVLRPLVILPLVFVIAGAAFVGLNLKPAATTHVATVSAAKRTIPDYHPLVPSESPAGNPDYNSEKNLVSYTTTFSDARVTVSEQPLPANFAADGSAMKRAADSINAAQKIDTAHGPLYVTAVNKDTGQMAIYARGEVLVFAHADKELDTASWKSFAELLQSKDWAALKQ